MQKRSGLGRGLGALIPTEATDGAGPAFQQVPTSSIIANRLQPREHLVQVAAAGDGREPRRGVVRWRSHISDALINAGFEFQS